MPVDHYENFPVASFLLPPALRASVTDLYRFARSADDIADEGDASDAERLAGLARYQAMLDRIEASAGSARSPSFDPDLDPIFTPLAATIGRHDLPLAPFRRLLSAFAQDVTVKRYADYPLLADYCQRSADPVGELMLRLYGAATPQHLAWSSAICTGLQLTNFWQDVGVDWDKGRIYMPQDDRTRFGVSEAAIAAHRVDAPFRALMAFEVDRARALLHFGAPLALALPGRIGWELRLVVLGGLRILERIEAVGYDVFRHRPVLGKSDWLALIWRACRLPHTLPATSTSL
jgi:squalene synthase HpnC